MSYFGEVCVDDRIKSFSVDASDKLVELSEKYTYRIKGKNLEKFAFNSFLFSLQDTVGIYYLYDLQQQKFGPHPPPQALYLYIMRLFCSTVSRARAGALSFPEYTCRELKHVRLKQIVRPIFY